MTLVIYGFNHKTASLEFREAVCSAFSDTKQVLKDLKALPQVDEVMIVLTCNRIELYCVTQDPQCIDGWLRSHHAMSRPTLHSTHYCYQAEAAVRHMLQVACGLDSMVMGEPQILGQLKKAYRQAQQTGTLGKQLTRLTEAVFAAAKSIRVQAGLNQYPVSVVYAALLKIQAYVKPIQTGRFLLIGAGSTVRLMIRHLQKKGCRYFWVAARRPEVIQDLTSQHIVQFVPLSQVYQVLDQVDAVVSATASPEFVIHADQVDSVTEIIPPFWIDLAVPRDIDPALCEQTAITLYNVDDLQAMLAPNWEKRHQAAQKALDLIDREVEQCMGQLRTLCANDIIRTYREKMYDLQQEELNEALSQLKKGRSPEAVVKRFAYKVTQKFLHSPSKNLRDAAFMGEEERLHHAKLLLDIEE